MLQFYFLSVMLNLLVGLVLFCSVAPKKQEETAVEPIDGTSGNTGLQSFFDSKNFKLVLGALAVLVGFMKLLSVVQNDVPVVGDLLPAISGLIGGFSVLLDFYINSASSEFTPTGIFQVLIDSRKTIGVFCIIIAILHFLFPKVLFL